jgi:hypothetical protein
MGDTLSVSIDTSKDVAQPTLEEEAAKYDNLDASTDDRPEAGNRPEWLPSKFKSPEDMAKAYSELEKKLGSRQKEVSVEQEDVSEDVSTDDGTDQDQEAEKTAEETAREATEAAGLNFDELSTAYWENGQLDDKHYEKLEKAGIPKDIVDQFIAGQEALLQATRQTVFETVGGEQNYNSMTDWASENFSKDEVRAYNAAVNGGDRTAAMMAVQGLKARYEANVGFEPAREVRGERANPASSVYRSVAELQKDMSDPRYQIDPAFRRDVERKLDRSNIF